MSQMTMEMSNFRIDQEEYNKIQSILSSLVEKSGAMLASLISRSGQEIAFFGGNDLVDRIALSALAASNLAATFGIAELIDEQEFERVYHRGKQKSILMMPVGQEVFVLFVFPNTIKSIESFKAVKSSVVVLKDLLKTSGKF